MGSKFFSVLSIILGLVISGFCIFTMVKATAVSTGIYVFLVAGIAVAILGIVLLRMNSKKAKDDEEEDE